MESLYQNHGWLIIAAAFFGVLFYIAWIRWLDRRWIERRFRGQRIVAVSFGVNYFGRSSEGRGIRKSSGFLVLLPDRLFYRSRFSKMELEILGKSMVRVYHGRSLKGVDLHQSVIKVDFFNERKERDTAAFRVPYPPQWIRAIEATLLQERRGSGRE